VQIVALGHGDLHMIVLMVAVYPMSRSLNAPELGQLIG
jgi:hypothetical protein